DGIRDFHVTGVQTCALPILRRTLSSLAQIGVTDVCVVDGEHADELKARLIGPELGGLRIEVLANRTWRQASGAALLLAADFIAQIGRASCRGAGGDAGEVRE